MSTKNISRVPRLLGSSADPNKIALTFKGIAVGLIPVIILVAKAFSIELSQSEILDLIESITAAISGTMVVVGLGRKIWFFFRDKFLTK